MSSAAAPLCHVCVQGKPYDVVVLDAVGLAPGTHDPVIVAGDEDDLVDALGLELVLVLDVRDDVLLLARRGEGAGDGDDDDLLLLALYFFVLVLDTSSQGEKGG